VAMVESSQTNKFSRMPAMDVPDFSQIQPVQIDPGQTLTFKINPDAIAAPGSSVRFTLAAGSNTITVPGFTVPGAAAPRRFNGISPINAKAAAPTTQPARVVAAPAPVTKSGS
jgi:hypothetical protein